MIFEDTDVGVVSVDIGVNGTAVVFDRGSGLGDGMMTELDGGAGVEDEIAEASKVENAVEDIWLGAIGVAIITEEGVDGVAVLVGNSVALAVPSDGAGAAEVVAGPSPGTLKGQHFDNNGSLRKTARGFVNSSRCFPRSSLLT